jgi:hypothetical protein
LVLWATDCAERVLSYFEQNYPKDNRLRKSLEVGCAWVRDDTAMSEVRAVAFAAHAAARDTDGGAACAASRAAGHAVATAHVGTHASPATNYALTAVTAAADPTDSAAVTAKERDWQYRSLPEHLRAVSFPARGDD